ncbi:hypothetical protein AB0B15_03030 [Streptomyces sp. NPDC045456]|uniref:hypothetical protein n=1 Tax=Streptomyces sp. NPDC045456 TaxID=3155254 RepID=UPI00340B40C5
MSDTAGKPHGGTEPLFEEDRLASSDSVQASKRLLRAAELLRAGAPVDPVRLRGVLADLFDDEAGGDSGGGVNPYVEAVAQVVLDPRA